MITRALASAFAAVLVICVTIPGRAQSPSVSSLAPGRVEARSILGEAQAAAISINRHDFRAETLLAIAAAEALAGVPAAATFDLAFSAARRVEEPGWQRPLLVRIIATQAKTGDVAGALDLAKQIRYVLGLDKVIDLRQVHPLRAIGLVRAEPGARGHPGRALPRPRRPAVSGLMIGHEDDQNTWPIGCPAELDAGTGTLTLLEPGVE